MKSLFIKTLMVISLSFFSFRSFSQDQDYVAKIGENYYASLFEAVTAANELEEATIIILKDFSLSQKLTIKKKLTIEGDYTISRGSFTGTLFDIQANAELTLDGGLVIDGNNNYVIDKALYDADLQAGKSIAAADNRKWFTIPEGSTTSTAYMVTMKAGSVINLNNITIQNDYSANSGVVSAQNVNNVTVNLKGAYIHHIASYNGSGVIVNVAGTGININMYEGTLIENCHVGSNHGIFKVYSGATITMYGGEVRGTTGWNSNGNVIGLYSGGTKSTFIMNGGRICSNTSLYGTSNGRNATIYLHSNSSMTMNGGTICHNTGLSRGGIDSSKTTSTLIINGGEIIDNISIAGNSTHDVGGTVGDWVINGGTFTQDVSQWISPDSGLTFDEETGTYTVTDKFFEYNGKEYNSFTNVIKDIKDDKPSETPVVKLIASAAFEESIDIDIDLIFDLNNYSILSSNTNHLDSKINVYNNATVTIRNGYIKNVLGATSVFSDNFDNEDLEGWRVFSGTTDTDNNNWIVDGNGLLSASSELVEEEYQALNPDNYIVTTEQFRITSSSQLQFSVRPQDKDRYKENYGIVVSEDNENWSEIYSERINSASFEANATRYIDLSSYEGKDIYIGFRHYDCGAEDVKGLIIDNVSISQFNKAYIFEVGSQDGITAGKLIIESGEFVTEHSSLTFQPATLVHINDGTLTILGGKFTGTSYDTENCTTNANGTISYVTKTEYDYLIDCEDSKYNDGDIICKGGSYKGFNPADNKAEGANTDFVPDGFISEKIDDPYWQVHKDCVTYTFHNKGGDHNWANTANWEASDGSSDCLPDENSYVIINQPVVIGSEHVAKSDEILVTATGSITIEDGGELHHNNVGVNATVKKNIIGDPIQHEHYIGGWNTISSPVNDYIYFSKVKNLLSSNYDFYRYDEDEMLWENARAEKFRVMIPGEGYLYANTETVDLEFSGELHVEDVSYKLSANAEITELLGFNLVGNPYAHKITSEHFTGAEISEGFYILTNAGAWGTILTASDAAIEPCQSILVQTSEEQDGKDLIIKKKAVKTRRGNNGYISINISNDKFGDEAYVSFNNGKGLNKINHRNENLPMVYIPIDEVNYAVAVIDKDTDEIPVAFMVKSMGEYTVNVKTKDCNFNELYLIDNLTGRETNLHTDTYTFIASPKDNPNRFTIRFTSKTETGNFAYINDRCLIVNKIEGDGNVVIYDIMGRPVANCNSSGSVRISTSTFADGIYIVKLSDASGVKEQKIVID